MHKQETRDWILSIGVDGSNNKEALNWKMPFGNSIDKGRVVKSSLEEELDISMKTKDARTLEHWGKVSSTSNCCFTILTT